MASDKQLFGLDPADIDLADIDLEDFDNSDFDALGLDSVLNSLGEDVDDYLDDELFGLLDDEDLDDELDDLDDEDLDDGGYGGFCPVKKTGRRASMARARRAMMGESTASEDYGRGYAEGMVQGMRKAGASEAAIEAEYNGLIALIGSGLASLGGRLAAKVIERRAEEALAPVEASADELPPVYVADEVGFAEDVASAAGEVEGPYEPMPIEDTFGEVVRFGFVGGHHRQSTQDAAACAAMCGSALLRNSKRAHVEPFVEDLEAEPILLRDGRIVEPVYGKLAAVPCPSCSSVNYGSVRAGGASSCLACDGHGAILVPETDVDAYGSMRYGALAALLIGSALAAGAGMAGQKLGIWKRLGKKIRGTIGETKEGEAPEKPKTPDEAEDDIDKELAELEESMGSIRAIIPSRR